MKSNLAGQGNLPCGCSKVPKWTEDQYKILLQRKADSLGYNFIGFSGYFKNQNTKIKLVCDIHGLWNSTSVGNFLSQSSRCPSCTKNIIGDRTREPDKEIIKKILESGAFHPDTKFWRSDRVNKHDHKIYWNYLCMECGEVAEVLYSNILHGHKGCSCAKVRQRQQEAYILSVSEGDNIVALKFGVANPTNSRVKIQSRKTIFDLKILFVYNFQTIDACKEAERQCKKELECGILTKESFSDGWSETTWVYNLDKIIEIYERNGGIRIE